MKLDVSRRSLITGLIAFAATAPAIVKASSLMPVRSMILPQDVIFTDSFTVDMVVGDGDRLFFCMVATRNPDGSTGSQLFMRKADEPEFVLAHEHHQYDAMALGRSSGCLTV